MSSQTDMMDHLLPAPQWLEHRLIRAVWAARHAYGPQAAINPFCGLDLGAENVEWMLVQQPEAPLLWSGEEDATGFSAVLSIPSFQWLRQSFASSAFNLGVILISLAPEIDLLYEQRRAIYLY